MAWQTLWNGYNAFYGRQGATALVPAITDATWLRFFDFDEPILALVAQSGARLSGLVHYLFVPSKHDKDRTRLLLARPVYCRG